MTNLSDPFTLRELKYIEYLLDAMKGRYQYSEEIKTLNSVEAKIEEMILRLMKRSGDHDD